MGEGRVDGGSFVVWAARVRAAFGSARIDEDVDSGRFGAEDGGSGWPRRVGTGA